MSGGEERVPKGYKQTEVGVIPEDWRCESLNEHARIIHGYGFKSVYFTALSDFHLTTPGNFYEIGGFRKLEEKQKFYDGPIPNGYILQAANLIIAMTEQADGLLGSAALVPSDNTYLHNQRLGLVKTKSNAISISYLYRIFNSKPYRQKVRETAAGTKVKHTSPQKLLEIMAIFPSIVEQDAITKSLSNSDSQIQSLENLVTKKRDIKQGAMQELLTGKTRLPGFSGEWEVKSLGEIGEITGAGVDKKIVEGETPVRLVNYLDVYNRSFIYSNELEHHVTAPTSKATRCSVRKGDIFFTPTSEVRDDIAVSAIAMEDILDATYSYHVVRLRIDDDWDLNFRAYAFQTKAFLDQAAILSDGSGTRYVISLPNFRNIRISFPEKSEQYAIGQILSDMDAEITVLEQRLEKTKAIKQGMMQQLLTGRIRLVDPSTPVEASA